MKAKEIYFFTWFVPPVPGVVFWLIGFFYVHNLCLVEKPRHRRCVRQASRDDQPAVFINTFAVPWKETLIWVEHTAPFMLEDGIISRSVIHTGGIGQKFAMKKATATRQSSDRFAIF